MMAPVLEVLGGHFNDAAIAHSGDIRVTTWWGLTICKGGEATGQNLSWQNNASKQRWLYECDLISSKQ